MNPLRPAGRLLPQEVVDLVPLGRFAVEFAHQEVRRRLGPLWRGAQLCVLFGVEVAAARGRQRWHQATSELRHRVGP